VVDTIERAFIYAMLMDKTIITKTTLLSKHFADDLSQRIFKAIRKIYNIRYENGGDSKNHISFINKNLLKKIAEKNKHILEDFEFEFDPSKIKFEEIASDIPNTWYVFANSKSGKVKFGALDQGKNPINGNSIPFKLKFSTIGNGVDILT
jgi:hypothetical protein